MDSMMIVEPPAMWMKAYHCSSSVGMRPNLLVGDVAEAAELAAAAGVLMAPGLARGVAASDFGVSSQCLKRPLRGDL